MGRSLGLLTKIENNEFRDLQEIDLTKQIKNTLFDFQELLELKGITIKQNLEENVHVKSDPILMQILIGNLFQNAVRHNTPNGEIEIKLTSNNFAISNTGKKLNNPSDLLFKRFKKDNQSSDTIGLGLAIVKKICEINNYEICYQFENERHRLTIEFHP
jgi:signal transduction histidine kinase